MSRGTGRGSATPRRTLLIGVIVWLCVMAVVGAVLLSRPGGVALGDRSQPLGALTPAETDVRAEPQADGSLRVEVDHVFDALAGSEEPVRWFVGPESLGQGSDRAERYLLRPEVVDFRGQVVTAAGTGPELEVSFEPPTGESVFAAGRYTLTAPGAWTPGRHAVRFSYLLRGVHVDLAGHDLVVLPFAFPAGPGRTPHYYRIQLEGGDGLLCLSPRVSLAEGLPEPCAEGDHGEWIGKPDHDVSAVAIAAPSEVVAQPVPAERAP